MLYVFITVRCTFLLLLYWYLTKHSSVKRYDWINFRPPLAPNLRVYPLYYFLMSNRRSCKYKSFSPICPQKIIFEKRDKLSKPCKPQFFLSRFSSPTKLWRLLCYVNMNAFEQNYNFLSTIPNKPTLKIGKKFVNRITIRSFALKLVNP